MRIRCCLYRHNVAQEGDEADALYLLQEGEGNDHLLQILLSSCLPGMVCMHIGTHACMHACTWQACPWGPPFSPAVNLWPSQELWLGRIAWLAPLL